MCLFKSRFMVRFTVLLEYYSFLVTDGGYREEAIHYFAPCSEYWKNSELYIGKTLQKRHEEIKEWRLRAETHGTNWSLTPAVTLFKSGSTEKNPAS